MKVFLYERVSSEEQAKHGYSLDAQHQALVTFCENNNHIILGTYKDEGISARKPYTKRPAMVQLLADLEKVKPDIILFTKLDRWFRNIKEYYKVQDILDRNKVFWKAINEEYDTSTASGRLYVNIKLSIAQDEADRTSERIKDVHSQLVAKGQVLGGSVPLGYQIKDKKVVFSDQKHITEDAVRKYLACGSLHATSRYINDKYGTKFASFKLKLLLSNPLLKGAYRENPNFCDPLIDCDTWDKLQEMLKHNIKEASHSNVFLFTGLAICPECKRILAGLNNYGTKYYRCNYHYYHDCTFIRSIREDKIEKWLLDHIEDDFKVKVKMKPKEKKENPQKYKDRLKRLNDMYLLGNISEKEYKDKAQELQNTIARLSKVEAPKEVEFTKGWQDVYAMLDEQHKRSFWHSLIKGVRFDEDGNPKEIVY